MLSILGLDIAGVLANIDEDKVTTGNITNLISTKKHLAIPPFEKCLEVVKSLRTVFGTRIHIVSVAKQKEREQYAIEWLGCHGFLEIISHENISFCRRREDKVDICKQFGITHFVDDRLEVLAPMADVVPCRYLFRPRQYEIDKSPDHLEGVIIVNSWLELKGVLII